MKKSPKPHATPLEADLGFARIDLDRQRRRGLTEVIFGPNKTPAQLAAIMMRLNEAGQNAFATRVTAEQADAVCRAIPDAVYEPVSRTLSRDVVALPRLRGKVAILCAGTSDIPVAEEAAITATRMGARVERIYDVGVAGLHRLLRRLPALCDARAVVVVAGMEGALPSVVAGLVASPVIAVPTSVGYGAALNGITALHAMLTSCASGVTVVNIDNGFGAGIAAAIINRQSRVSP